MFATPYDTTAGTAKLETGTVEKLKNYLIVNSDGEDGQLLKSERAEGASSVYRLIPGSADIPTFGQPLLIEMASGDRAYIADIRPFVSIANQKNRDLKIHNYGSYDSIMDRLIMQVMWDERGAERMMGMGSICMTMYSRWVTNTLTRRLTLSQESQYTIGILAAYFYYCLHSEETNPELDAITKAKVIALVRQATNADMMHIKQFIDATPIIRSVKGFITAIQEQTQDSRLSTLNDAGLFVIIGPTFIGNDARLTACVALEHPPTFIASLYGAIVYKGASMSGLGQLVKNIAHGQAAVTFKNNYLGLVKEFK